MHSRNEEELRLKARQALREQDLPSHSPDRTFGGPGNGTSCPVCGALLASDDMVFDLEFDMAEVRSANYQLHVRCFAAWELEREQIQGDVDLHSSASEPTFADCERNPTNPGHRK